MLIALKREMGSHVGGSGKILFQCRMKQKDIKSKVLTLQKVAVDGDPLILMFMSSIKKGVHRCSNHSVEASCLEKKTKETNMT